MHSMRLSAVARCARQPRRHRRKTLALLAVVAVIVAAVSTLTAPAARAAFVEHANVAAAPDRAPTKTLTRAVSGIRFSLTVPAHVPGRGWYPGPLTRRPDGRFRDGGLHISKDIYGGQAAEAVIYWTAFPQSGSTTLCRNLVHQPVGRSAAELAAALAKAPGTKLVRGPVEIKLGGHRASKLVLKVRTDLGCDPGFFYTWRSELWGPFWSITTAGDTIRVWLTNLRGVRLFIAAVTRNSVDAELAQEIQQIVESIRF